MMKPEGPDNTVFMEGSLDHYYKCCSYPRLARRFFVGRIRCKNCGARPVFAYTFNPRTGSTGPH